MKTHVLEKMMAVACALALAVGVMSGAVFARDEEPVDEPAPPEATFVVLDMDLGLDASPADAIDGVELPADAAETYGYLSSPIEVTDNRSEVPLLVDGQAVGSCVIVGGVPWVSAEQFCRAVGADVSVQTEGGQLTVSGAVELSAAADDIYIICNDRYILVEDGVRCEDGTILLPVETLAKCFGVSAVWDRVIWTVSVDTEDGIFPLESGRTFYAETDVYWLSHVIYAEAGNQSLRGQIAVGDVVLNRVADPAFAGQNDVYDVIFAKNQFEVVVNGMIYMEPSQSAVIAAKLALEGYDVTGGATYFATFDFGDGYECVCWIEDHCFMIEA